jgi:hypothetical protein
MPDSVSVPGSPPNLGNTGPHCLRSDGTHTDTCAAVAFTARTVLAAALPHLQAQADALAVKRAERVLTVALTETRRLQEQRRAVLDLCDQAYRRADASPAGAMQTVTVAIDDVRAVLGENPDL